MTTRKRGAGVSAVRQTKRRRLQTGGKPRTRRQAATAALAERVTNGIQRHPYDGETPRPSWRRYYQAYATLLEEGQPVTETAIAKVLRITRMSLWRIHRRNPGLRRWVHDQLRSRNECLIGPVIHMLGTTAMRTKSPKHAELFLKAVGAIGSKDDEDPGVLPAGGFTMNFLVPAPPIPVAVQEQAAKRLPPPMTFDVSQVPAVSSRGVQQTVNIMVPRPPMPLDVSKVPAVTSR